MLTQAFGGICGGKIQNCKKISLTLGCKDYAFLHVCRCPIDQALIPGLFSKHKLYYGMGQNREKRIPFRKIIFHKRPVLFSKIVILHNHLFIYILNLQILCWVLCGNLRKIKAWATEVNKLFPCMFQSTNLFKISKLRFYVAHLTFFNCLYCSMNYIRENLLFML